MEHKLTWEDGHGVVHAIIEDKHDGYPPPHALMSACSVDVTWLNGRAGYFGHVASTEIRMAARRDPLSCLGCIAYYCAR